MKAAPNKNINNSRHSWSKSEYCVGKYV